MSLDSLKLEYKSYQLRQTATTPAWYATMQTAWGATRAYRRTTTAVTVVLHLTPALYTLHH